MKAWNDRKESRLRVGVVGCGRVFERFHLPALRISRNWRLVAACDTHPERRRWVENAAAVPVFDDLSELLVRSSLDAFLVTSPPPQHASHCLEALRQGVHVLVEKPMATSSDQAAALVAAAEEANVQLRVGFNRRFRSCFQQLAQRPEWLSPNCLGSLDYVLIVDRGWNPVDAKPGRAPSRRELLDDVASHQLDLLPWLLGHPITRLNARAANRENSRLRSVEYALDFRAELVARCVAGYGPKYRERLEINAPGGSLLVHPWGLIESRNTSRTLIELRAQLHETLELSVAKLIGRPNQTVLSFVSQLDAFAAAIRDPESRRDGADGDAGLRSVLATEALETSLKRDGQWIALQ